MYYLDTRSKNTMIANLNKLRILAFPSPEIAAIKYNDNTYSQLAIKPNIVQLTISGLYTNMLGVIDSLTFSIDDGTPWATIPNATEGLDYSGQLTLTNDSITDSDQVTIMQDPYPTVVNVSVGMKIIENPMILSGSAVAGGIEYRYEYKDDTKYFTNSNVPK
jgi:hypothetical protein